MLQKVLVGVAILGGWMWMAAPARAQESQPPQAKLSVTCTTVTIDPQPGEGVRFTGTIGTHTVDLATHPGPGPHDSSATISAYTTATGPISGTLTPQWTVAPNPYGITSGPGIPVSFTLTCHEAPTTTTMPTTTTSTTVIKLIPPVTAVAAPCTEPRGCCLSDCGPTLPNTGSTDVGWEIGAAGSLVLAGLALASRRFHAHDTTRRP